MPSTHALGVKGFVAAQQCYEKRKGKRKQNDNSEPNKNKTNKKTQHQKCPNQPKLTKAKFANMGINLFCSQPLPESLTDFSVKLPWLTKQ